MVAMTLLSKPAGPMTRADLDALPDDGYRHELIDGVLVMSPAPRPKHQQVLAELYSVLRAARPSGLSLLFAPLDVALSDDTVLEPDLLVARPEDFSDKDLPVAPLLAVEILSPSTRRFDLTVKKARYEAAGTPSYWGVDPDELRLIAWDLVDGEYVQVADVGAGESWTAELPFPVTIDPAELG